MENSCLIKGDRERESQRHGISLPTPRGKGEVTGEDGTSAEEESGGIASNVNEERLSKEGGVHRVRATGENIVVEDPFSEEEDPDS